MKLAIILNTNNPETAWNALRLAHKAVENKDSMTVFLLGSGVEIEQIQSEQFKVQEMLKQFVDAGGKVLACGTCLKSRNNEGSQACPASNLDTLYQLIKESDKVITL
jgi:uncharacterized protein involved in oxidation of intracellular sulfur